MTNQDRLTSPGPARDDPELGDTTTHGSPPSAEPAGSGQEGPGATDRAKDVAATGRDQAQQVASSATDQARDVASTARSEAQQVAQTAQGQARRMAHEARHELRTQADSQVERLADGLGDLSRQLRTMGERGDPGPAADLAGQAAERTQYFADRLRSGGWDDAIRQVRNFGRNRPGLFLLGAFGVGLAAGRVVRNMAEDASGNGAGSSYGTASTAGNGSTRTSGAPSPTPSMAAMPGEAPVPAIDVDADVDPSAQRAYGAPDTPIEPPASNTAPVGEQRWGS
jgi:hypothetical protein